MTPLNVNCHASDGRKSTPLLLAAGYNRTRIIQLLLQHGADVQAKDKGGLMPLHHACSYGHFEVTELLIRYGALVSAMYLWQFTPLHEAASKNRVEVCCSATGQTLPARTSLRRPSTSSNPSRTTSPSRTPTTSTQGRGCSFAEKSLRH